MQLTELGLDFNDIRGHGYDNGANMKGVQARLLDTNPRASRWECRVDSVRAVRYQLQETCNVLIEVSEATNDPKARSEAISLSNKLKDFMFIVSVVFWYFFLFQVNSIRKQLQDEAVGLPIPTLPI